MIMFLIALVFISTGASIIMLLAENYRGASMFAIEAIVCILTIEILKKGRE